MKKKILLTLAMVVMLVCVLVLSASAADAEVKKIGSTTDANGLNYTVYDDGTASLKDNRSYSASDTVVIPSTVTYNGTDYTVTATENYAFYCNSTLKTIYFPSTITKIGESTIVQCPALKSVYIDLENLVSIGTCGLTNNSKTGDSNIINWDVRYYPTSEYGKEAPVATTVARFTNIVTLGTACLQGAPFTVMEFGENLQKLPVQSLRKSTMETLIIKGDITFIGNWSVAQCASLRTIEIRSTNLITIENTAISGCPLLESITIDLSKCEDIGDGAFEITGNCQDGNVTNTITQWYNLNGEKIVDLSSCKHLGYEAFGVSNVGSATIIWPKALTDLENQAFRKANISGQPMVFNAAAGANISVNDYVISGNTPSLVVLGEGVSYYNFELGNKCTLVMLNPNIKITRSSLFKSTADGSTLYYAGFSADSTYTSFSRCQMIQISGGSVSSTICGVDCSVTLQSDSSNVVVAQSVHTDDAGAADAKYCPVGAVVNYTCTACKRVRTVGEGTEHNHTVAVIVYNEGFLTSGIKTYRCAGDGCTSTLTEGTATLPIFVNHGYSSSEVSGSITQGFVVNREAYNDYISAGGNLTFGLVAAVYSNATGFDTTDGKLFGADGVKKHDKIAVVDFTSLEYDIMEMVVTGLNNYPDTPIYCCLYYVSNGQVGYINEGVEGDTTTAKTLSGVIGTSIEAVIPSKEENV